MDVEKFCMIMDDLIKLPCNQSQLFKSDIVEIVRKVRTLRIDLALVKNEIDMTDNKKTETKLFIYFNRIRIIYYGFKV